MSFESDGQGPAGDERLGEQRGRGSVDHVVQHKGVVELDSGSETSPSDAEAELSASEASSASDMASDASESDGSVSLESAAESPPAPDGGGPDELQSGGFESRLQYNTYAQPNNNMNEHSSDLFGLAAHALAAQDALHLQEFNAQGLHTGDGPELTEINISDTQNSASESASSGSRERSTYNGLVTSAEVQPEVEEPEVEEPEAGLVIEEIGTTTRRPSQPRAQEPPQEPAQEPAREQQKSETPGETSRLWDAPQQPAPVVMPNLEEIRETVRAETRSRIRSLEKEVQRLESSEWELRRKLNDATLQTEAARAERERTAVSAAMHGTELQRLRSSMEQLRTQHEARTVELRTAADEQRVELEAQRRAHDVLRDRFAEQSGVLADSRAAVAELERARIELESQTSNARRAEQRAQLQLSELRDELDTTLSELASARAELTLQTQAMADIRAQAREEALEELAPASTSNEESMWRERYVDLRRQMDAVATEFERREPEVLALQREHAEAEARAEQAQDDTARARSEKAALERKLRAADRRASDLLMEQQLTEQRVADLRRQVLHLLTDKMLNTSGDTPLSPDDEEELARLREQVARDASEQNGEIDGQALISERLLLFKDVAELQFQNEALLKACRGLAKQLDPDGDAVASAAAATSQRSSADEIREAGDALEALQKRFVAVQSELDEMRRSAASSDETASEREAELTAVRKQLKDAEGQIADLRRRLAAAPGPTVNGPTQDLNLLRLELQTERTRLHDTQRQLDVARDEVAALSKRARDSQSALARAQQKITTSEAAASEARAEADQAQVDLAALRSERALWAEREQRLMSQVSAAQAEAQAHARNSGASQSRQADLESKLIGTMERLETLVASSAGEARAKELQEQADAAESRSRALQTQINSLESELNHFKAESSSLRSKLETVTADLEAAQKRSSQTSSELTAAREQYDAEKANFQKRDDDLVEQVNNLEDSLTEVREKLRVVKETQESERKGASEVRQELEATQNALQETRQSLDVAQKEVESERQARLEPQAADLESAEVQKEREDNLRREIEAQVRPELEKQLRADIESALRAQVEGDLRPAIEASIRSDVESALKPELEQAMRPEVESALRLELEKSMRAELESTLRPELEASIRSELAQLPDNRSGAPSSSANESDTDSSEALRAKIEAEVRAQVAAEKSAIPAPVPTDVQPLFDALMAHAPKEEVEQFQQAVLSAEQARVKSAFRKRLDDVREAAEAENKTKIAEAEKRAEEKAAKRGEMRTKLQTQKLTKLESKNKELEAQVEELRNKVRRLKGGATDDASKASPIQPAGDQQQPAPQEQSQPFIATSGPFAPFQNPHFQFTPGNSAFGLDQSQKRQSFFPDNDNQKKRKEEESLYENQNQQ